jgi:hypothetical protein
MIPKKWLSRLFLTASSTILLLLSTTVATPSAFAATRTASDVPQAVCIDKTVPAGKVVTEFTYSSNCPGGEIPVIDPPNAYSVEAPPTQPGQTMWVCDIDSTPFPPGYVVIATAENPYSCGVLLEITLPTGKSMTVCAHFPPLPSGYHQVATTSKVECALGQRFSPEAITIQPDPVQPIQDGNRWIA